MRKPFAPPTANDRHLGPGLQLAQGAFRPSSIQLAIAIDKLNELEAWIDTQQAIETGVSCAACGKRNRGVEQYRARTIGLSLRHAAIAGSRIHVNHFGRPSRDRLQAAPQSLSLIATDQDESQPTHLDDPCPARLTIRAGTPTTVAAGGTSRTTTAFAPTT